MRSVFNSMAKFALLRAVVYLALGVVMLIIPSTVLKVVVYVMGGYLVVMGAIAIIQYFRHRKKPGGGMGMGFVGGIVMLLLAVALFVFTKQIISILPIFLGVLLALGGAVLFVQALNAKQATGKTNIVLLVIGLVVIVAGVVVVLNPFSSAVFLMQVFGVALLVMAIGEVVNFFTFRKVGKAP